MCYMIQKPLGCCTKLKQYVFYHLSHFSAPEYSTLIYFTVLTYLAPIARKARSEARVRTCSKSGTQTNLRITGTALQILKQHFFIHLAQPNMALSLK